MLKISSFQISNFRSFKKIKNSNRFINLNLINILTGENNTGKTNILRAIKLFFNPELYDPKNDMNYINKITGGASSHPTLIINIKDSDNDSNVSIKLKYTTSGGKINYEYEVKEKSEGFTDLDKNSNSKYISQFLNKKFKIVYLGVTDDLITNQANKVLTDMILTYYTKNNKSIKQSVDNFKNSYKNLIDDLHNNLQILSEGMKNEFRNLPQNFYPELEINNEKTITDFLIDNFRLKINDIYSQTLQVKGSGVQRSSIILMNLFLVNNLYRNTNTIILLDEPEAFLYPTLVKSLKDIFQKVITDNSGMQMFITSHSSEFISESKDYYSMYDVTQEQLTKKYQRSPRDMDIVKYSVISPYDSKIRNSVLLKYGLLDDVDNVNDIIILEGRSDRRYILKILPIENRPQIRIASTYDWNYIGNGASGILPMLHYLDTVSEVKRNILIVLDGDDEGNLSEKKINAEKNLSKSQNIKIYKLKEDNTIEDYFFDRKQFIKQCINIQKKHDIIDDFDYGLFEKVMSSSKQTHIQSLKYFLKFIVKDEKKINGYITNFKYHLSNEYNNLEINNYQKVQELEKEIHNFFNDLYN